MIRTRQAVRNRSLLVLCTLIGGGLALSAATRHLNKISEGQAASPRSHSVDLKWKASTSRVVGYNVYRSEKADGPYRKLTSVPIPLTSYTDRTVRGGHTYFYKVTAVNDKGRESLYSNQFKAIVPSP